MLGGAAGAAAGTGGGAGGGSASPAAAPAAGGHVRPNILITGTPGTGKSTLLQAVVDDLGYKPVDVGALVKEHGFHAGHDPEFDTLLLDDDAEDQLLDHMEPIMAEGGVAVEFHSVSLFPERWFDLVLVLRTDNTVLYDRLKARGYTAKKITENVECEILRVVLDEAKESYDERIVQELRSDSVDDMMNNVARIGTWSKAWTPS